MDAVNIISKLKDHQPAILGQEQYRQYAVLLPLVEVLGETHVLFELRSMRMRSQQGEVCFPGGRIDKEDPDPKYCAIRETSEELGLDRKYVEDVIPLDYMVNFGRIIYPFTGRITGLEMMIPNEDEVEEVFTVPLSYFLHTEPNRHKVNFYITPEADFPFHLIPGGEDYNWRNRQIDELFYEYDGKVIWGLTAKIMKHFVELLTFK